MSRSKKKTPAGPIASSKGMKQWKRKQHRKTRSYIKNLINKEDWDNPDLLIDMKEYSEFWDSPSDGKTYYHPKEVWEAFLEKEALCSRYKRPYDTYEDFLRSLLNK